MMVHAQNALFATRTVMGSIRLPAHAFGAEPHLAIFLTRYIVENLWRWAEIVLYISCSGREPRDIQR
jgi:hypothetical protein